MLAIVRDSAESCTQEYLRWACDGCAADLGAGMDTPLTSAGWLTHAATELQRESANARADGWGLRTPAQRLSLVARLQRQELAQHKRQLLPDEARDLLACAQRRGFAARLCLRCHHQNFLLRLWVKHRHGRAVPFTYVLDEAVRPSVFALSALLALA